MIQEVYVVPLHGFAICKNKRSGDISLQPLAAFSLADSLGRWAQPDDDGNMIGAIPSNDIYGIYKSTDVSSEPVLIWNKYDPLPFWFEDEYIFDKTDVLAMEFGWAPKPPEFSRKVQ